MVPLACRRTPIRCRWRLFVRARPPLVEIDPSELKEPERSRGATLAIHSATIWRAGGHTSSQKRKPLQRQKARIAGARRYASICQRPSRLLGEKPSLAVRGRGPTRGGCRTGRFVPVRSCAASDVPTSPVQARSRGSCPGAPPIRPQRSERMRLASVSSRWIHGVRLARPSAPGRVVVGGACAVGKATTPETVTPLATVLSLAEITPESSRLA